MYSQGLVTVSNIRQFIREVLSRSGVVKRPIVEAWVGTESQWTGMSVDQMFREMDRFKRNTWIFFDTETTGLKPGSAQITEIAAVAVNPHGFRESSDILGTFNMKSNFTEETLDIIQKQRELPDEEKEEMKRKRRMSVPEILSMTRHGVKRSEFDKSFKTDEMSLIEGFIDFVESYPNPMLVIQNADFDVPFTVNRYEKYGGDSQRILKLPVLDTKVIIQMFLIPTLKELAGPPTGDREAQALLKKMYVQRGQGGYHSASQGVVSQAYGISADEWHSAIADVKMMMEMLRKVMESLEMGRGLDIDRHRKKRRK